MDKGWDARGLLRPLWQQLDGPAKRDRLAELAGISPPQTLSAYNTGPDNGGRALGLNNARKIVAGLAKAGIEVSLLELGAPASEADARGLTLIDRLEELAADLADSMEAQAKMSRELGRLRDRVQKLEAQSEPAAAASSTRRKKSGR